MTRIVVVGPASWNRMVVLDALPDPVPHMEFARDWFDALGGTSAGKSLHLHALGREVVLDALVGDDEAGGRIRAALARAGVAVRTRPASRSEQHLNLMTPAGARLSLYLATPEPLGRTPSPLDDADLAVLDLAPRAVDLLPEARERGVPVWTDLHDYDGESAFHRPFLESAEVVFMNADRTDDPWALLARCLAAGPRLAVCTLGAEGAIALDGDGVRWATPAVPADVVDTNGAGDAFFAGFLDAHLAGAGVGEALGAGARQAVLALASRQLHPVLAD
ncbi:carbohydrate kinase family protein [Protaetiibacter mangrovi]|uniref:PfkB family carbohydrate kinase n=1 Tax=Protaetiibacter mangrovi TaxID=2970926 RepID=A0ABT1ZDU1_9MICO|nr:PfkB family carbohydrate kinase [Protaetiibacter mangrovi]MCS0498859.1 PfkB family carbohydrate kinase [Protaetiibacter mangrovi]TPX04208.1 carbohydrate kinase family protein [Schumannella luteola]